MNGNSAYVCGPLTELTPEERAAIKAFYVAIADLFEAETGVRAFVPHEHYDPVKHGHYTAPEVDAAEREQVCERTSLLIVVAEAPSWGGGIEVEMANRSGIPVIILCEQRKLEARKISRLLRGNPSVVKIITFDSHEDAIAKLRVELPKLLCAV